LILVCLVIERSQKKLWLYLCLNVLLKISLLCVCPLLDGGLCCNIVKVAVEPQTAGEWFRRKL